MAAEESFVTGTSSFFRGNQGQADNPLSESVSLEEAAKAARRDWDLNGSRASQNYSEQASGSARGSSTLTADSIIPPRWVPDDDVTSCGSCRREFDWARRKHHCRCCGQVFCYSCSQWRSLLPRAFETRDPQRVCQPCHQRLEPLQEPLIATCSNAVRDNDAARGGLAPYLNSPLAFTLGAEVRKAAYTIQNFCDPSMVNDKSIPQELLARARGLAFLTVIKGGFVFAGRVGTGLVVARLPSGGWSAPSAIATVGVSWGAQLGGEITDFVLVLNTEAAVDTLAGRGQFSLGAEVGVAVGPLGRTGAGSMAVGAEAVVAPVYSYSHSRGLFAGISIDGAVIAARTDVNTTFYGKPVAVKDLLHGVVPPPNAARPLYDALNAAVAQPKPMGAMITSGPLASGVPVRLAASTGSCSPAEQRP